MKPKAYKKAAKQLHPPSPPAQLIRIVRAPEGRLLADVHGKLPCARPLFIGASADVWRRAQRHHLAALWFGADAALDAVARNHARDAYQRAITDTLSMAHKAGEVMLGLDAVKLALQERETELVIIATDAGGADKKALLRNPLSARYCHVFGKRQALGQLFARRAQVYLAVRQGVLAVRLAQYLRHYAHLSRFS